ncbi:MAG: glycosyltransferase [Alphaproteobacteria bacterium]|nr:glycosyltransferase [Alphaproteobacteria bacterium]
MTATGAPPIEVMHVVTSLDVGGAETVLARLAAGDAAGAVSHSVVSLKPGGALRDRLEANGIPVRDLGIERNRDAPGGLLRLAAAIRGARPAVVHSWLYHADLLATLALVLSGRRRATRLIWGVRCSDMDMSRYAPGSRLILTLLPRLSRRADLVLCNAEAGRAVHQRLGYRPARWRVVPNGVDLERFRPRPGERAAVRAELGLGDGNFVVGMCARVDPMKDHATFVKAAAFAGTVPEARFVLIGAGTGEPGSALERTIAAAGLSGRFVRLGLREDIPRLQAALDVAALSSAFGEGFPNVLAEAMACGVPCAATNVGDSAAIVGDTGLVVPPGDPEALAGAWAELRSEGRDARAARGAEARRRISERYSLAAMIDAYRTLYGELAMPGGARAGV